MAPNTGYAYSTNFTMALSSFISKPYSCEIGYVKPDTNTNIMLISSNGFFSNSSLTVSTMLDNFSQQTVTIYSLCYDFSGQKDY